MPADKQGKDTPKTGELMPQGRYERRRALLEEQQQYGEASSASELQQEMISCRDWRDMPV